MISGGIEVTNPKSIRPWQIFLQEKNFDKVIWYIFNQFHALVYFYIPWEHPESIFFQFLGGIKEISGIKRVTPRSFSIYLLLNTTLILNFF